MRIGFMGPAGTDDGPLDRAVSLLLGKVQADQAIYLGDDGAAERLAASWQSALENPPLDEEDFLTRAAALAISGSPEAIRDLLEADARLTTLANLRTLPPAPARAVEMIADRVMLMVADKSVLDEEDITNASIVIYGKASSAVFRRFGTRYFFSPGPLAGSQVGVLEVEDEDVVVLTLLRLDGTTVWREVLQSRTTKIQVSS